MENEKEPPEIEIIGYDSMDSDRYDRQKRINGWDQKKISNSRVMVIGVGATGNELVKNLVMAGVGTLLLIDYDLIESSNLNRCILFNNEAAKAKKYKVDVVKEACKKLNPEVEVITLKKDLNDMDKNLYKEYDVICSCLD
ncbi:MAG: ThiF family adenylyltransferase, partial [Promethearchaeota archaeon]